MVTSTDSTPESTPSNVGETVSTGEQVTTADPNVSAPDSQIDIGWSLEDQPEQPALPENDDDIQGLLNDPALDQSRVPGLVTELRSARQIAKESKRQVAELRQQLNQLEQFGGMEGVKQSHALLTGLVSNPEQGVGAFLGSLHKQAYPAYERLVNDVIRAHPEYAIQQLQASGKLPATQTSANQLTAEDWGKIPQEFREIAKQVPVDQLINWIDNGTPESLLYNLQREAKLNQLDSTQREQAERQWREQSQQAQQQGQQAANDLGGQYMQAHYKEMSKWKPLGPDNEPSNQMVYKMAYEGAFADMLSDPKFSQMYADAYKLITNAPMRRLQNEGLAADADEREARRMAAQINTRLGQILRERVKLLDSVFRDARAYRESQRSEIPQRTEISGLSTAAGANGEPARLTNDGKVSDKWMDWMISRLPGRAARQG